MFFFIEELLLTLVGPISRFCKSRMDSFGNYPREKFDPFSMMLFKGLQVVAFLFFIAVMFWRPQGLFGTKG